MNAKRLAYMVDDEDRRVVCNEINFASSFPGGDVKYKVGTFLAALN